MSREAFTAQLDLLPEYLGSHLLLTVVALGAGILLCVPLAVFVTRVKPLQWPVLTLASVLQTIPGIALLALMVPLLGQIGFLPAFIALLLYSMLPILRNTVTGILGVDATIIEAARGAGMTSWQMLFRVELPLAAPVIIAGVRTATAWVVGTATLSTPVGATSLGNFIFGGLQTQNYAAVSVGCIAAAVLAIVLDQLIHMLEVSARRRNRLMGVAAGAVMLILAVVGLLPLYRHTRASTAEPPVIVGAKTFTEQYILAQALTTALRDSGFAVTARTGLGSTILFDALAANEVDCYVDYSGTIWATIMKRQDVQPRQRMLDEMTGWLEARYGIRVLGPLGFENTYALAMRRQVADQKSIANLQELTPYAPMLTVGSDYEFFSRAEWASLTEKYRLNFARQLIFDPSLMYAAIREGKVDVISAYSTDGRIVEYDLKVLDDPKQALPPYDAVLLLSPTMAKRDNVVKVLRHFVNSLDDNVMRHANKLVDVDRRSVVAASRFILDNMRSTTR